MALTKCPKCQNSISPKAEYCPSCGHPIVAANREIAQKVAGFGCCGIMIGLLGLIIFAAAEGSNIEDQEKAHPTCVSDYTKCKDNADLLNHHESKDGIHLSIKCKEAAEDIAEYGTPEFPWIPFDSYHPGRSYIDGGEAVLIERDAQYKNAFNADVHVTAICHYDLRTDTASVTLVPH